MSKYVGELEPVETNILREAQVLDLIDTYLSDIFTYVETTTDGTNIYNWYKMPGTDRQMVVKRTTSSVRIEVYNLARSASLNAINIIGYGSGARYVIIKNANSGCFLVPYSGTAYAGFVWCTVDGVTKCTAVTTYELYPNVGSDAVLPSFVSGGSFARMGYKCEDLTDIFFPTFISDDSGVYVLAGAVPDIFGISSNPVEYSYPFTVNGVEYFMIYSGVCIRVNT